MKGLRLFIAGCVLAAAAPFLVWQDCAGDVETAAFAGWPKTFDGRKLKSLPLTKREKAFAAGFPGKTARFTDGEQQYILRWVTRPSRKLHPAADCFRASGYRIKYLPLHIDEHGATWSSFEASREGKVLCVRERIYDDEVGRSFSDVSSWYWAATFDRTNGPWWAVTVITTKE